MRLRTKNNWKIRLPEPETRNEELEQVERASNELKEHSATCILCCKLEH